MIDLLARIPYFKRKILAYALRSKKPKGFEGLELAFKDVDGVAYYTFTGDFDVFIKRKSYWDTKMIELDAGLTRKESEMLIDTCLEAINSTKPNYALVAHLLTEMKNRHEWLVHHEIMYDLVAACYVREDEDPTKVDMEIHRQKVDYFLSQDDLSFFFENQTLSELLPYLENLSGNLKALLKDTEMEVAALKKQIDRHTSAAG